MLPYLNLGPSSDQNQLRCVWIVQKIEELIIENEDSENMILFRMIKILFGLLLTVENSNGELRRTAAIISSSQNSRIAAILTAPEQQICVWIHNCYSYFENSSYSAIPDPSKHTLRVCLDDTRTAK
jgi:hypothetical protein